MKKTVIGHLEELRRRVIVVAVFIALFSVAGIYFSGWFIRILIDNLITNVPVKFISVTPFEFIATQIKLGVLIGFIIALPVLLYHLVKFVRPALRRRERKYLYTAAPASLVLFALGLCGCFGFGIYNKRFTTINTKLRLVRA